MDDLVKRPPIGYTEARAAFDTLCEVLDGRGWQYDRNQNDLTLNVRVNGDDLFMELKVEFDPKRRHVYAVSPLPFGVPQDKRAEIACAVNMINCAILEGCFDFGYHNGMLVFRYVSSFRGSILSKEMFERLLNIVFGTVDDYNDKLFLIMKGKMTLGELKNMIDA